MTGQIDESCKVSWMLSDERHKFHCGDKFIFKNHQEGLNTNDANLRRAMLQNRTVDGGKMRLLQGITFRMILLFTQEVHFTVWIYGLAVWTRLLTVHIVRGARNNTTNL